MQKGQHWSAQQERGHRYFLQLTKLMVRYLPLGVVRIAAFGVSMYFYLTSAKQRRAVGQYQQRLRRQFPDVRLPRVLPVYRQFAAFAEAIADRFAVWQGKIRYDALRVSDPDNVYAEIRHRGASGQILVCSHLGNVEVCRALVSHHTDFKLNVLVHNKHAEAFNRALKEAGASDIAVIQVAELSAEVMMTLAAKLDAGEWLAVAADRTPVRGDKTVSVPFCGSLARFPQGVWLLAGLLKAKTNTIFVLKQEGRYHLMLRKFAGVPAWKRHERVETIRQMAADYAQLLSEHAAAEPLQWFNFYNFWEDGDE